jgi:hypothetical protein
MAYRGCIAFADENSSVKCRDRCHARGKDQNGDP